ncbi:SpoIIE family protein phosphatase [Lachnospiraceae bacterium NSJ-46]|uniref:SpoIIE family protein phosphatase n=2 Tax=Jingyaoa shaoxingensis TaxID=2763671 RepID=A0ABR7NAJ0_9FIRM|nr:SpoIIE family protein phosphatase [Jingyaoa shaoxingensis]
MIGEIPIDFGKVSLNKKKEKICGDYYTIITEPESSVLVLSDGLGSGVKANILATLTAKMLSIMIAGKVAIRTAVKAVADTLPVCSVRNLAYATFTVMVAQENEICLLQYDNPDAILLRNGKSIDYRRDIQMFGEKEIHQSYFQFQEGDMLILMSDGVTNAGMGKTTYGGWGREEVVKFCEQRWREEISAQEIASAIGNAGLDLNLDETDDDLTVLVMKGMKKKTVNIMVGPPADREDDRSYFETFFQKEGMHVVCGGTTAKLVADYLHTKVINIPDSGSEDVPAMSEIKGIDLVTEGLLTLQKLMEYYEDFSEDRLYFNRLIKKKDGAAELFRILFTEATEINFFFGNALNENYTALHIDREKKKELALELIDNLEAEGKKVKICFWCV